MNSAVDEVYESFKRYGVEPDVLDEALANGDTLIDTGDSYLIISTVINGPTPCYDKKGNYTGSYYCPFMPKGIDNKS